VWTRRSSGLDLEAAGLRTLASPAVVHVAIANPAHAPYGRAAVAALQSANVYDAVRQKLVFGENVEQALQFAQSGAADVGIVALSLALAPAVTDQGRYVTCRWRRIRESHRAASSCGGPPTSIRRARCARSSSAAKGARSSNGTASFCPSRSGAVLNQRRERERAVAGARGWVPRTRRE